MNLALAHGIYNFKNRAPAEAQDSETINSLCNSFKIFSNNGKRTSELLLNLNPKVNVNWCGEYGCSWVAVEDIGSSHDTKFNIFVIAPDAWQFSIHSSSRESGRRFHSSSSDCYSILTKHSVLAKDFEAFKSNFQNSLSKCSTQTQNLRSAATNERGHQKTPAFILALLCDAHPAGGGTGRVTQGVSQARGAFTDVGLHTGGTRRNTCWAIVESTIKFLLRLPLCEDITYEKFRANFDLWVVDCFLKEISTQEDGPATDYINAVIEILAAVALNLSVLAEKGWEVSQQESKCLECRQLLDELVRRKMERKAAEYMLPNLASSPPHVTDVSLTMPSKLLSTSQIKATMSEADINYQLSCYRISSPPGHNAIYFLTTWITSITSQHATFQGLCSVVNSVEEALCHWAADLTNEGEDKKLCSMANISEFPVLWSHYSQAMAKLRANSSSKHLIGAELRSRELLSAWILYCLLHRAVCVHFPLVREYDVCLRGCDLRHLVLSDRRAVDAAVAVHSYLSLHSKTRQELFSMRMPEVTYSFAERYTTSNANMASIYETESAAAAQRKADRWRQTQRQKTEAAELRITIADIQTKLTKITLSYGLHGQIIRDSEYFQQQSLKNQLLSKQQQLTTVEKPPPPIFQPLPSKRTLAMRAIGILYLPIELRHLFESGLIAQSLLSPKTVEKTSPSTFDTIFQTYYSTYSSLPKKTQSTLGICASCQKPSKVGSSHIDMCRTDEDGIWYPDQMLHTNSLTMLWNSFKTNPFSTDSMKDAIVAYFTDAYTASDMIPMQYTLLQAGEEKLSTTRGNLPIAQQSQNQLRFSKPEFLEFGTIRAYPYQQIRRICSALRDRSLLLSDPNCRTLLRQALYHLGEFSTTSSLVWKQDLLKGPWLQVLEKELSIALEAVGQTMRESNSLSILGELASYISQWLPQKPDCSARLAVQIGKRCGDEISKEIDDLKASIVNAVSNDVHTNAEQLTKLCFKQAIYYMTALCCFSHLPLTSDDIADMVKLRVLANKSHALASQNDFDAETTILINRKGELSAILDHVMTLRVRDIVTGMGNNFSCLTKALQQEVHCLPHTLTWKTLSSSQYCFEAQHGADTYHINIISGIILINGSPPSILPASILDHPVYRRTFGNSNFEVSYLPNQSYRTVRHLRGRMYEFSPPTSTSRSIIIREIDSRTGLTLELLDGTPTQQWQGDMPVRLKEHYSHWLDREKNVLLLRPIEFWDRKIVFFAVKQSSNKWEFREFVPLPNISEYNRSRDLQGLRRRSQRQN